MELEASLPSYVLKLQLKAPQRITTTNDGYLKRKYREEKRLDNIYDVSGLPGHWGLRYRFKWWLCRTFSRVKTPQVWKRSR